MASTQYDTNLTISIHWATFLNVFFDSLLLLFFFFRLHKRLAFDALATNHQ